MSLFTELKRRNVFKVGAAYTIVGWMLLQVSDTLAPALNLPGWFHSGVAFVLILGFPLALVFAWAFEMTPQGIKKEKQVPGEESITHVTGRKLDFIIIGLLVVAVGYFAYNNYRLSESAGDGQPGNAGAETADEAAGDSAAPLHESVAVLPFINISGDPENEYFSDGLTETLLHMLAQLPDLHVSARTSSFAFKGKDIDIREIAQTLDVAHVLEGSVQKASNQVRITAQLIRAEDGFHVWSQNYDRTLDDIFAIQDEIASDVASALGASLLGGAGLRHLATSDVTAYDLYLQALNQQNIASAESFAEADRLFRLALEQDPGFVDAMTGLARNYLSQNDTVSEALTVNLGHASSWVERALETEPDNSVARLQQLFIRAENALNRGDLAGHTRAVREIRTHMAADSSDSWLVSIVAYYWLEQGNLEDAQVLLDGGLALDPLNNDLLWTQATMYIVTGELDKARAITEEMIERSPDYFWAFDLMSSLAWSGMGDVVGSTNWVRKALETDPGNAYLTGMMATTFFQFGMREEGDRWLEALRENGPDDSLTQLVQFSGVVAGGDADEIIRAAEAFIQGDANRRDDRFDQVILWYCLTMAGQGRSREALDFLQQRFPGLSDYSSLASGYQAVLAQFHSFRLMVDLEGVEAVSPRWLNWLETINATGFEFPRNDYQRLVTRVLSGDLPGAHKFFINEVQSAHANLEGWLYFAADPVFTELRAMPDVAARLSEVERERKLMRKDLETMLLGPEWQ